MTQPNIVTRRTFGIWCSWHTTHKQELGLALEKRIVTIQRVTKNPDLWPSAEKGIYNTDKVIPGKNYPFN